MSMLVDNNNKKGHKMNKLYSRDTGLNDSNLNIGDYVLYLGWNSNSYKVMCIMDIWNNKDILIKHNRYEGKHLVRYTLRNVRGDRSLGKIESTCDSYRYNNKKGQ